MGTAKDVYDIIKDIKKFAEESGNVPFYEKVIQIQSIFFDLKEEISDLKEQSRQKTSQIEGLMNQLKVKEDVVMNNKGYIKLKSEGHNALIYCSHCFATEGLLIPMVSLGYNGNYQCDKCKNIGYTQMR